MNLVDSLIERINNRSKCIVVIGDIIIDRWVHGHIEECQDGCPKFVKNYIYESVGGAANAHNCLSNWAGITARLCGGINRPVKHRFMINNAITWRYDDEVKTNSDNCSLDHIIGFVNQADGVLLSDYDKGLLTPEFISRVVARCNTFAIPCVADVKRAPELYAGCILKSNMGWRRKHPISSGVTTRECINPLVNGEVVGPILPPVYCVNHVGAGDCFAAHLILALAYGFSLEDAATIAHSAGEGICTAPA